MEEQVVIDKAEYDGLVSEIANAHKSLTELGVGKEHHELESRIEYLAHRTAGGEWPGFLLSLNIHEHMFVVEVLSWILTEIKARDRDDSVAALTHLLVKLRRLP